MEASCRQWVFDFVAAIFGAYDAVTGRRLIRYFFLLVAKKNSKSTIAAGIMLTALLRNWRMSAEFLILAPTIEVAGNSFKPALDMIRADADLAALLHPQENLRTITHRNTGATLKVIAADSQTVSGKKTVGLLVEELWLFGKQSNAENMIREAIGGLASRPEGFVIYLTTQSDTPPAGVFLQKLEEFRDVRDGKVVDPRSMPVLYEFPPGMLKSGSFRERQFYHVTNPNLGASVDEEFLADEQRKAQRNGPHSLNGFFAKHLNVEIGLGLRLDHWAGARHWQEQAEPGLNLDKLIERSDVVTAGVDGGGLDDMLGMAVIGRDKVTGQWLHWARAWIHRSVLDLRKSEAPKFLDLQQRGDLVVVDKMNAAFMEVADIVEKINVAGVLNKVGFDPVGVKLIVDELSRRGISQDGGQVEGISQGYKLQGTIKATEDKLSDGDMVHCGQPLMAWCVGNAKVEPKGNAILITKQASGTAKIDPLMATFNAVALMAMNPEPLNAPSVYEGRGFLVV